MVTLTVPENFLNVILRQVRPSDSSVDDVNIAEMITFWYKAKYPDLPDSQIRKVVHWYITNVVNEGTDLYRESKFDSHVLTEVFRLREENIALKKEIAILKEYAN